MKVTVCIATHCRIERLELVLVDLTRQTRLPDEVVVVDNDAAGSARAVIAGLQATVPFALRYDIQPERNIAMTRNRTVALATGDWIAFIDDDERAPPDWLEQLCTAASGFQADGVLGPVEPQLPPDAPAWIRRGRFYDFPHCHTGEPVPLNRMRFGNLILRGTALRAQPGPFDIGYGLTTGEDGDLLVRMVHAGARIIWCDEAVVREPVEPRRLSLRWILLRALSGGQEFARQTIRGRYGPINAIGRTAFFLRVIVQIVAAAALALLSWPAGRHRAAAWLVKLWANLGKLSVLWGRRYRAYA